jgi:hypothetical protein
MKRFIALAWLGAWGSVPVFAHHAQAPFFDQSREVEIEGVVTRFDFRNPHPILYIEVTNAEGQIEAWQIQFSNATGLRRQGWTKDSVQPGERVRARGHPSRNPGTLGLQGQYVTKQDGSELRGSMEAEP